MGLVAYSRLTSGICFCRRDSHGRKFEMINWDWGHNGMNRNNSSYHLQMHKQIWNPRYIKEMPRIHGSYIISVLLRDSHKWLVVRGCATSTSYGIRSGQRSPSTEINAKPTKLLFIYLLLTVQWSFEIMKWKSSWLAKILGFTLDGERNPGSSDCLLHISLLTGQQIRWVGDIHNCTVYYRVQAEVATAYWHILVPLSWQTTLVIFVSSIN